MVVEKYFEDKCFREIPLGLIYILFEFSCQDACYCLLFHNLIVIWAQSIPVNCIVDCSKEIAIMYVPCIVLLDVAIELPSKHLWFTINFACIRPRAPLAFL